jgi:hypothetical protein
MHVFSIINNKVVTGAKVEDRKIQGGAITIQVVSVGEEGRGRLLGYIPVSNCGLYTDDDGMLLMADVGLTRAGTPKLVPPKTTLDHDECIVVLKTGMGYRGGNTHTGDRFGWACKECGNSYKGQDPLVQPAPRECPMGTGVCGTTSVYARFPGQELAKGIIAQGMAGAMGSGEQKIVVMPKDVVFRTEFFGRMYGQPGSYYYRFNGETIERLTWDERVAADIW